MYLLAAMTKIIVSTKNSSFPFKGPKRSNLFFLNLFVNIFLSI